MTKAKLRGRITLNKMNSKQAKALREHNEDALKDWLDALPDRYQGSPDIEQVMEKGKMGASVPLKSASYKRLEGAAGKHHASDGLLWRIFERDLPEKMHRAYDAVATDFLLAPNGCGNHIAMRRLEDDDNPVANELGMFCRRVFEFVLDELDRREYKLCVPVVERPKWSDYQNTEAANADLRRRYDDYYRSAFKFHKDHKKARAEAVKRASADTGYTPQNVRRLVG